MCGINKKRPYIGRFLDMYQRVSMLREGEGKIWKWRYMGQYEMDANV
jgi:hypothetical protein